MSLECLECSLTFKTKEELANHKKNFCVESQWHDPLAMQQSMETEESMTGGQKKALSFDEVRNYLRNRTENATNPVVGALTLNDMRDGFRKNDQQLELLHQQISRQREKEKVEELRQLKIKQQKARAQKNKEERELRDLIKKLENKKEQELRHRMEKEMIQRELRNLDAIQLKQIESDRKEEIAKLARERAALKQREDDLLNEVKKLEERLTGQEKRFKEEQKVVNDYFNQAKEKGQTATKKERLRIAQHRGQRAAELRVQRAQLIEKQKQLIEKADKMKIEISKNIASMDIATGDADKKGGKHVREEEAQSKDELTNMIENIQGTLGETQVKLNEMKQDFREDKRRILEEQSAVEAELNSVAKSSSNWSSNTFAVQAKDILGDWVSNEELERDEKDVQRTKKHAGIINDELDNIVAKTSLPSNVESEIPLKLSQSQANVDLNSSMQSSYSTATMNQPASPLRRQSSGINIEETHKSPLFSPARRSMKSLPHANSSEQFLDEIEMLKREYYASEHKDPNVLLQIQELEREANGIPRDNNMQKRASEPYLSGTQPGNMHKSQSYGSTLGQSALPTMPPNQMFGGQSTMLMMMMQQQQQQQQQQMAYNQQMQMEMLRRQNEEDRRRMQQDMQQFMLMSANRANNNSRPQRKEYDRIMRNMQRQISMIHGNIQNAQQGVVGKETEKEAGGLSEKIFRGTPNSSSFVTEEALQSLAMLPRDSELYKIQMKHLESITKIRFKMQELAQQQELQQMQHDVLRLNQEHEKELEHEAFMSEKRRQLRAARIQRILAKEMPGDVISTGFSTEYDPHNGFTVFFDFATDIHTRYKRLQVVYCFAVEEETRTKVRATPVADCEKGSNRLQQCIISMSRQMKKVPALPNSRCVLELQSVGAEVEGRPSRVESVGWCAFDLFTFDAGDAQLNAGLHKLPLQRGQVNFHQLEKQSLPNSSHISMYVRLCNPEDAESFKNMSLDPQVAGPKYTYPSSIEATMVRKKPPTQKLPNRVARRRHESKHAKRATPKQTESPEKPKSAAVVEEPEKPTEVEETKVSVEEKKEEKPVASTPKSPEVVTKKEWEEGLGVTIHSIENSELLMEYSVVAVRVRFVDENNQPLATDDKLQTWETDQIGAVDEEAKSFSYNFDESHVFHDVPKEASNIYAVFEILNDNQEVIMWNAIPFVEGDEISKGEKELDLLMPPVEVPVTDDCRVEDAEAFLLLEFLHPKDVKEKKKKEKKEEESAPKVSTDSKKPVQAKEETKEEETKESKENLWFMKVERGPLPDTVPVFAKGDCFDVYVDGARYLPSNVTISRCSIKVLPSEFGAVKITDSSGKKVKEKNVVSRLSQDAYSPMWGERLEFREESFDTTSCLMIRVDTVEEGSKDNEVVGYASLNLFNVKGETYGPEEPGDCVLNEGGHQIPIYYGAPTKKNIFNVDNLKKQHDRVPCATVLVRILPAKKREDGSVISASDSDSNADDLYIRAPAYTSGAYDSSSCIPKAAEELLYKNRYDSPDYTVAQRK